MWNHCQYQQNKTEMQCVTLPIVIVAPLSDRESWCTWEVMTDILHYLNIQVAFLLMCGSALLDIHCRVALHMHKATTQNICSRTVHTNFLHWLWSILQIGCPSRNRSHLEVAERLMPTIANSSQGTLQREKVLILVLLTQLQM